MRLIDLSDGMPALWKSDIYGDVAVHVASMYNGVIQVTVDGGESARQVIDHPELLDGWFVVPERLHKRASKRRTTKRHNPMNPGGVSVIDILESVKDTAEVTNSIRDVPGVGKVAFVSADEPKAPLDSPLTADELEKLPITEIRRYARKHYSTIGKLTKKADILAAIRKLEMQNTTEEF